MSAAVVSPSRAVAVGDAGRGAPFGAEPSPVGVSVGEPQTGLSGGRTRGDGARRVARPTWTAMLTLWGLIGMAAPAFAQTTTVIDGPQANATVGQPFSISGWSVQLGAPSGTGVDVVHIQGCPTASCGTPTFWGAASYGSARPDIGAAYGSQYTNSGYSFLMSGLAPGEYRAEVWAHSTVTNGWYMTPVTFTVTATPFHVLEAPTTNQGVTQPFTMSGWAIDASAPTSMGTGVDAIDLSAYWNYGNGTPAYWLGVATYGGSRPDVAAAYGARFELSGYTRTIAWQQAGWYWFTVSSHNTASNTWTTVTRTAFVDIPTSDLTITRTGTGTGAITATGTTGGGLNCPGGSATLAVPCPTLTQPTGTVVTITAVPDAGSTFVGWTGGCVGAVPCNVTLNGNRHATAIFAKVPGTFDVSYYHTDVIGSVRAITDDAGLTVVRYDNAPFGEDTHDPTNDPFRYAGKELDPETRLHYFAARYYRNTWGRFTTVDPLHVGIAMGDPQQWNRYAYARNNPLAYGDPSGLCAAPHLGADGKVRCTEGVQVSASASYAPNRGRGGGGGGSGSAGGNGSGSVWMELGGGMCAWSSESDASVQYGPSEPCEATGFDGMYHWWPGSSVTPSGADTTPPSTDCEGSGCDRRPPPADDTRSDNAPVRQMCDPFCQMARDVANRTVAFTNPTAYAKFYLQSIASAVTGYWLGKAIGAVAASLSTRGATVTLIGSKIEGQLASRGWTTDDIIDAVSNPARRVGTRDTRHLPGGGAMDDPATAFYSRGGGYVVRNNRTGDVVQISDRNNSAWRAPWD